MNPDTLLWRQIHPTFIDKGEMSSRAFRPTRKDNDMLSVENGDQISAHASWLRFTTVKGWDSIGVGALSVHECESKELKIHPDGVPDPEHVSVDFSGKGGNQQRRISIHLARFANNRGWQYLAPGVKL